MPDSWVNKIKDPFELHEQVEMKYAINEDLDVCIKISKEGEEEILFLFEAGHTNELTSKSKSYIDFMNS